MSETDLISVKELAQQLDVSDALLKKFIRDFGIDCERIKKRIHLPDESVAILQEILRLRASGKKNKEIKQIFDQAIKAQPVADAKKETKEKEPAKAKEEKKTTKTAKAKEEKKTTKAKKSDKEDKEEAKEDKKATKDKKATTKRGRPKKAKEEEPEEEIDEDLVEDIEAELEEPEEEKAREKKDRKPRKEKAKKAEVPEEPDFGDYVTEQVNEAHEVQDEIALALQEIPEDEDEDIDEEALLIEEGEDEEPAQEAAWRGQVMKPRKMRRRAFNFRYIQRQIANDSRKIDYINHKLKRSNISQPERVKLEGALEHRAKLLSGWLHLLRWVKSKN